MSTFFVHTAKKLEELLGGRPVRQERREPKRATEPERLKINSAKPLVCTFLPKLSETYPMQVGREPNSTGDAGHTPLRCSSTTDRCNPELNSIKVCLTRLFLYENGTSSAGSVCFVYPCVFIVGVWFSQ